MKSEFVDVSETRKTLSVELPGEVVDAEFDRLARDYSRRAKLPGFRPGKVPVGVIRSRFRDQILHDVARDLIPKAVEQALREKGVEPVATPEIRDVVIEEHHPLTFTAAFETVPPIDPGDYATIRLTRPPATVTEEAVDAALERLRERAARYEPVEGRAVMAGDTVVVDLDRESGGEKGQKDHHDNVSVEINARANPPGFDEALIGLETGATKTFAIHYPEDYAIKELAGTDVTYTVRLTAIKGRVVPALDDEFAKDMGEFETLAVLRARVRDDLQHESAHQADHQVRASLMSALAARVLFDLPEALVERESDRRVEEFMGRLVEQQIDPRQANIDWDAFRESQKEAAREAVASALVLDEVARREQLVVADEDVESEIGRYAERSGHSAAAVRARIEKDGGLGRLYAGLRREKSVDFLLSRATIEAE